MQYEKEIILKDGAKCLLRGAGEADAAEVLRTFDLTHAETDYFLTYPEENSFTVQEEAKFLKARSESKNAIEIAAFVDARIAGTAGTDPIDDDERVVDTHIKNLRKKLGIDFIQTIRGVGYKIDKEN